MTKASSASETHFTKKYDNPKIAIGVKTGAVAAVTSWTNPLRDPIDIWGLTQIIVKNAFNFLGCDKAC